ncbi:sugar transferase [Spirilliplanes yamanashiensis]|uniref:Exopolysaccharide biosynthesis polyprenyl glycosylphosphotransferase n=1 Tax=Spirilliplanes yamanashiensis TaxID=42233 RepID=A0A8J4DL42_9ACTN|nr:sugar transferase [Spirilliplanes yamanashiensis]MDP9818167.1 exopolysaccharide biosynthesis polyprenyl glycosylphosphotransferase [Spirilliplanes yamanashiensis]GIJ04978.1 exopolysaccharide biosynthesis polyprenyl glycosylphosphotransferase [Spirilliplanes yamanashiensis]
MTMLDTPPPARVAPPAAAAPAASVARRVVPHRPWEGRYLRTLVLADLAAALLATATGYLVRFGPVSGGHTHRYLALSLLLPFCWLAALSVARAYETRLLFVGVGEYQHTLRAGVRLTVGTALVSYAFDAHVARGYLVVVLPLMTALSMTGRFVLRRRLHRDRARGVAVRRVLAVGRPGAVADLARQLRRRPHHGLQVVAACVPDPDAAGDLGDLGYLADLGVPVAGDIASTARSATRADADTVIVLSVPELDGPGLRRLAWALERDDVELIMASSLLDVTGDRIAIRPVDGLPLMHIEHPRLSGGRRMVKGVFEFVAALSVLAVVAPVMLAVAVLVKLDSPGPALFRQDRVGRHGRAFPMVKFRTMHVDAEQRLAQLRAEQASDGVLFKLRADPRVTRTGRFLRRYSLDELPQILNVLRGHMSLVGPRPPLAAEVANYPDDMRRRLVVKPGMTGLWQVSGRSDLSWEEAVRLDLQYVENWSLSLDLMILLRTVVAVVRGSGAY